MKEFRNISDHPDDLEDGRVIGVGETFELDDEQMKSEFNKDKISRGVFLDITGAFDQAEEPVHREELLAKAKDLGITGRTTMRNDELQTALIEAEENQKGGRD